MKKILLVSPEAILSILGTLFLVAPKTWLHSLRQINSGDFYGVCDCVNDSDRF